MLSSPYQQVPSRRTDQIIGRKKPLKAIHDAIQNKGHTWLLYFYGPGGIGKTRLLEEVTSKEGKWKGLSFRCTHILDMYHSDYQSSDGIRHGIVTGLERTVNDFCEYHAKRKELAEKQMAGASRGELQRLQTEVAEAFLDNYRVLAQNHRLVICLDTMELMQHESDPVQEICRVKTVDALVMNWLVEQLPILPNTVILMAGRPENRSRIEETFAERFYSTSNSFKAQPLDAFSPKETGEYLKAVSQILAVQGNVSMSKSLDAHKNLGVQFHRRAGGRPVYLALMVDLFLTQSEGEIRFVNDILAGREFSEDKLAKQLIDDLRKLPDPHGRIIQNLFKARKGLDADLLTYLGEEEKDIESLLKWLENLAIVKVRQTGDKKNPQKNFFFHDELYNMYDQYFRGDASETIEYQQFVEYYRQKLQDKTEKIALEKISVDSLYYELRVNPKRGYHFYYARWDHAAIVGHDHSYDMRLRNEVLGFLNRYVDPRSPFYDKLIADRLDRNKVDRDCAVRWVRRHWALGNSRTAREVAVGLIASRDPLFDWNTIDDDFYKADLLVALVEATVQEAADIQSVFKVLNRESLLSVKEVPDLLKYAIAILQRKAEDAEIPLNSTDQWHYHRILGASRNRLGYLYRTTGRYGIALRYYRLALNNFEKAQVESELAFVLTNIAFLLGINSRTTEALRFITRAIELNKKLKRNYPLALALNTKGRIFTLDNHPNWGVRDSREALTTVKKVGDSRGIGLALNGLGFSLRKQANQWKFGGISKQEAELIFIEAKEIFTQAITIFSRFNEPIRLWEAYNEMGSLHCDWAWLIRSEKDKQEEALIEYKKAFSFQEKAKSVVDSQQLEAQYLDSLDDLAQVYGDRSTLHYILNRPDEAIKDRNCAEDFLNDIESRVKEEYKLLPGSGFSTNVMQGEHEGETKWLTLGKLHLWRGVWRFRDIEFRQLTEEEKELALEQTFENLFISSIYFRRYWVASYDYERPIGILTAFLPKSGKDREWAQARVQVVEKKYNLQLPELHDLVRHILLD